MFNPEMSSSFSIGKYLSAVTKSIGVEAGYKGKNDLC